MDTHAQINANRPNAGQSAIGNPKSAIKHGILARVVPADIDGWQELLTGLYESLRPQDELQRFLVDQIALSMLRLQRSAAWEAQTLARPTYIPLPPGRQYDKEEPPQVPASLRVPAFVGSESGQALLRYENACNRQIKRNLELLMKLQSTPRALPQGSRERHRSERVGQGEGCEGGVTGSRTTSRTEPDPLEGAAPSAPLCPEDTRPQASEPGHSWPGNDTATQPCVSHARRHAADIPQPGSPGVPAFQPGPSGPGGETHNPPCSPRIGGWGAETELASFRNNERTTEAPRAPRHRMI